MRCLHAFFRWLIPVVGLPLFATAFTPSEDGIYAVFDTSEGEIVARLFYLQMPMTVGNFMRLADGAAQTLDQETGRIEQKRYYDGLTIDRVEAPFGIIGGAPGGRPEGGPGYSLPNEVFFIDRVEFLPFSFAQSGRLAMLDTGFNANGSQFFITTETESLNDTPTLFGKHSVFGEILSGMDRVRAIEAAPRDGNTLLVPVIINAITLVRKGALAEAFDPLNPAAGAEVPSMEPFPVSVRWESAEAFSLTYQKAPWSTHYFYASNELTDDWRPLGLSEGAVQAQAEAAMVRAWSEVTGPGQFFARGVRVRGLTSLSTEFEGFTLQVVSNGEDPIRFIFESDFKGRYEIRHNANNQVYSGTIAAWRAWRTGLGIQLSFQFETLVVPTGDATVLVTQPQQVYIYFDANSQPLATFTHFVATPPVLDDDGAVVLDALPAANRPGTWSLFRTEAP